METNLRSYIVSANKFDCGNHIEASCNMFRTSISNYLTNQFLEYGAQKFNAVFTRALQQHLCWHESMKLLALKITLFTIFKKDSNISFNLTLNFLRRLLVLGSRI